MNYTLTVTGTKQEIQDLLSGVTPYMVEPMPGPIESDITETPDPEVTEEIIGDEEETDASGAMYDPEIHSSSRAKLKDGTWKKRRGSKKAPAPPVDDTPGEVEVPSDFPALMNYLTDTLKMGLPEMNALAIKCGVADGIFAAVSMPEKVEEIFNSAKA